MFNIYYIIFIPPRITAQANAQKALEDKKRIAGQAFNEKLAREEAVRAEKEAMIKGREQVV